MTEGKDHPEPVREARDDDSRGDQRSAQTGAAAKNPAGRLEGNDVGDSAPAGAKKASAGGEAVKHPVRENTEAEQQAEAAIPDTALKPPAALEQFAAAAQEAAATLEKTAGEISGKVKGMAARHESATVPGTPAADRQMRLGHIGYLLFALGPLTGVSLLFGIFLCRLGLKADNIGGTLLQSHFRWLSRTFMLTLAGAIAVIVIAWLFGSIAGYAATLGAVVWYAFRIVKGWLSFYDGKDIANPHALW